MDNANPAVLLQNPQLVQAFAPWCVILDNLELAIILLAQPWIAGGGVRRAELERRVERLNQQMPLGPVYFQRINRAVAGLEERQCLCGSGSGRARGFVTTPQGFTALVLNLNVLEADPTLDPGEFEFKLSLVAMWNMALERVGELPDEIQVASEDEQFFEAVEGLTVLGRKVVSDELMSRALDVLRLIEAQRKRVQDLRSIAQARLSESEKEVGLLESVDLTRLSESANALVENPEAAAMVRNLAAVTLPRLSGETSLLRYDAYLSYLDSLAKLYAKQFRVVDIEVLKRISGHGRS
jgi:hypothetical protein